MEFQQALVDRAQLLDVERGVVDPPRRAGRAVLVPGQPPESVEQVAVGDRVPVERLRREEVAVQYRQPERGRQGLIAERGLRLIVDQEQPQARSDCQRSSCSVKAARASSIRRRRATP